VRGHGARSSCWRAARSSTLARRVSATGGAPIGEVFSFLSSLYFRGKLGYAERFSRRRRAGWRECS
jgi:hypothetical protein